MNGMDWPKDPMLRETETSWNSMLLLSKQPDGFSDVTDQSRLLSYMKLKYWTKILVDLSSRHTEGICGSS